MKKILTNRILLLSVFFSLIGTVTIAQVVARVDKKTKEFTILPDQKANYTIFGYEFANNTTRKMIAFSSNTNVITGSTCPLGAYFDTYKMKPGDKILYMGPVGPFGRFNYVAGNGKRTNIYMPKTSYVIK